MPGIRLLGVDFRELAAAFARFDAVAILVTTLVTTGGYWLMAIRMNFLSGYVCGNWVGLKAFFLSMAVNNVAPAKLGELAKAFYLRRECSFTLSRSISMVFWERFFDLNAILAMGIVVAIRFKLWSLFLPLALGVGTIRAFLFFIPHLAEQGPGDHSSAALYPAAEVHPGGQAATGPWGDPALPDGLGSIHRHGLDPLRRAHGHGGSLGGRA